ncbi:MAG: hypothetical protein GVY05_12230 [Bacteroidetes bacterium]|jgi:hypothetical protein|nr:hypothetical protein [Bacteroidota bacterium]
MLRITLFVISVVLTSCKSVKNIEKQPDCPEGYECYGEVLKDQSISIHKDGIGKTYIKINQDESHNVIKYIYKYSGEPNIADDSYIETFYFQIPQKSNKISLSGKELKNVKALVQKSCFCPDAGYALIEQGHLDIKKQKDHYYIKFKYTPDRNMSVSTIETQVEF